MKFLISGGTGLIGSQITKLLISNGHQINILSRKSKISKTLNIKYYLWDPKSKKIDERCLDDVEVIINLAGSSVFSLWIPSVKRKIINSRLNSLSTIYELLNNKKHKVKHLISASAIGIYPNHQTISYSESSDFKIKSYLADVVQKWESKANDFKKLKLKVSILRIGLVLSKNGGILEKLIQFNKLRIVNTIDGGNQWQSWINIDDLANMFYFIAKNKYEGIFNAVSPNPVSFNKLQDFVSIRYKKPFIKFNLSKYLFTLPFKILNILDFYHDMIASNKKVSSNKIQKRGFKFVYKSLENLK